MFEKTVAALVAVEEAIKSETEALFVPFDAENGSGGGPWHGAGAGLLQEAFGAVNAIRTKLESQEPDTPAAVAVEDENAHSAGYDYLHGDLEPTEAPAAPKEAPAEVPADAPAPAEAPAAAPVEEPEFVNPTPVPEPEQVPAEVVTNA